MFGSRATSILLVFLLLLTVAKASASVTVSVDANPSSIPADGKSNSQILVTVLDMAGSPVPDDTEVRLTTSSGDITPAVRTLGGRATGILTSSTVPQIAVITALALGQSSTVQVEFVSGDGEQESTRARSINIKGGSLAYSVDRDIVFGSSDVTIEYNGITMKAITAQVCQMSGQIRGQGRVSLQKDDKTLTGDAFSCDMRTGRVSVLDSSDQSGAHTYDTVKLDPVDPEKAGTSSDLMPLSDDGGNNWIIAERLVLIPGQKILFYKASLYLRDSKVITVPYYTYSYEKRESILQQVRYSSTDGILVDFPFYYQMAASGIGAFKLRYAANGSESGGYLRPRKGLSIGLEQNYFIGDSSRGTLFVDAIGSSKHAYELSHQLDYGSSMLNGGRIRLFARYQPHSSYAEDMFNTTLSVVGNLRGYNYSLSGYLSGSKIRQYDFENPDNIDYFTQSNSSIRSVIRPNKQITNKHLGRLSPSLTIGYGSLWNSSEGAVSSVLYQSLGLGFDKNRSISGNFGISFNGTTAFTLTADGDTGVSLRLGPTFRKNWTGGSGSLGYTYNLNEGTTDSVSTLGNHRLTSNLFLNGSRWYSSLSADYGLDSKRLSLYSTLNYRIAKGWSLQSIFNLYRYAYQMNDQLYSYQTSYLKAGIYRSIGQYEIGIAWSPNGRNYGVDRDKHIWLELGGRGF